MAAFKSIRTFCAFRLPLLLCLGAFPRMLLAEVYEGGGVDKGLDAAKEIEGIPNDSDPRAIIGDIVNAVLSYTALIAVIVIIIAGFYLLLSLGNDENKEKAKKIITYTVIGLVIIVLAKVIVQFFIQLPQ